MKAALRCALRARRRDLQAQHPEAAHQLIRVFNAVDAPLPSTVAVYVATGSELDPSLLATWLAARGVRIALPVVVGRDAPLVFREDAAGLKEMDVLGIPVPPPHAPERRPDLLFVPLLGFDRRGGRLGQGGGYYDRTLEALRHEGPAVRAIGIGYAGQEIDQVPTDPFDQRLDGVLTEKAYLTFS